MRLILFVAALLASIPVVAFSTDFYVYPVNGSMSNDGSQAAPWSTFSEVWTSGKIETRYCSGPCDPVNPVYTTYNATGPVKPGDTVYLMSGYHGSLSLSQAYNSDWITIKAATGQTPAFKNIYLGSVEKWIFDGITISPSSITPYVTSVLVNIEDTGNGPSHYITIKNSNVFGPSSISGYTAQNWSDYANMTAIHTEADHSIIENNSIYHVGNGIESENAAYSDIKNNTINHISGDGIQALVGGNYTTIEGNTIKNIYTVDGGLSHKDMIQLAVFVDSMVGAVIRGNTLILSELLDKPFTETCQGIGIFDGWFDDIIIENNLIITDSYHGITAAGARGGLIANNTVLGTGYGVITPQGAPIKFLPKKSGDPAVLIPGENNTLVNNFTTWIETSGAGSTGTVYSGGVVVNEANITNPTKADHFINAADFNYNLKNTSAAVGVGNTTYGSPIDITGYSRAGINDIGAYQYRRTVSLGTTPFATVTTP